MEGQKIVDAVTNLFKGVDERDWDLVQSVLAKSVYIDYTSMKGGEAGEQTPEQVKEAWSCFMPGFDSTNHKISAFRVQLSGSNADVHYTGVADHFIGDEVWTVAGTYHTKLKKENDKWVICFHKLNYDSQSGNTSLPRLAHQNIAARMAQ